ncbi:hypothetical protein Tco_1496848 [Tanacetum coccineum]
MVVQNQTELGEDKVVYKELGDSLVRAATTASSLKAEHDSGNITKTQSKATPNESSSLGTTSGGCPRRQETMGDIIAQTRVLDLEKIKTTQAKEIVSLKRRVKKLEQKKRSRTHGLKRLHKVGMSRRVESSGDEDNDAEMFDVNTLAGDEVFAEQEVVAKDVNLSVDEVTLAQALAALKSVKPKDKVKGIMVEEPMKTTKKKGLIRLDEEIASKLQAKIKVDHELAQRLQAKEQEELYVEEKAKSFQQLLEQRRKHFAAKSAEEKRNKPPTQAQQRKIMCTYLKNMKEKKPKDLKNNSFDSIQKMFDRAFKRVDTFVDF